MGVRFPGTSLSHKTELDTPKDLSEVPEFKKPQYQILPPLLPDEYERLKTSIAERGVEVPIIVDQHGDPVDGFHRQRASDDLGVFCPREVRHFDTEAEKFELMLRLNCRRRQLNRQQKRDLIGAYLVCDPKIADNHLAELIGGVSQNTVTAVRRDLEVTLQIEKFKKLRGRDGKDRPTKYRRVVANTAKEAETALSAIGDLPPNCHGKIIDCTTAKRRSRRLRTKLERQKRIEVITATTLPDDIIIQHCDLRDLEVSDQSAALVLTDVMWNEAAEKDWQALGRRAFEWLKPNGLLASFIGQHLLVRMARAIEDGGLHLQWIFNGVFTSPGNAAEVNGVISRWRPVVVFSKCPQHIFRKCLDTFDVGPPEKEWSHLQQTVQGAQWLLEHLSEPGDLIVDPCMGTGTTAVSVLTADDGPRRFLGCDRDEQMVQIARHRAAEALQAHNAEGQERWALKGRQESNLSATVVMPATPHDVPTDFIPM